MNSVRVSLVCILLVAICAFTIAAVATAGPEFTCLNAQNPEQTGPNEWKFDYLLSNYGGQVPIYDVEFYGFQYGWLWVNLPDNWAMEVVSGPMARFVTDSAPCNVEHEIGGFTIYAATPILGTVHIGYSDQSHVVFATGTTLLPVPEPGSLLVLGSGFLGLIGSLVRKRL